MKNTFHHLILKKKKLNLFKTIYRIWDKIAVGAYKILVFVAIVILTTLRRFLLKCKTLDNVLDTILNVSVYFF